MNAKEIVVTETYKKAKQLTKSILGDKKGSPKKVTVNTVKELIGILVNEHSEQVLSFFLTSTEITKLNAVLDTEYKPVEGDYDKFLESHGLKFIDKSSKLDLDTANRFIELRKRCQQKGLEFDLTLNQIRHMLCRKRCQITNQAIDSSLPEGHPNKLSFERIDNTKGYTRDNVIIICAWINQLKCDLFECPDAKFELNKKTLKSMIKMFEFYSNNI